MQLLVVSVAMAVVLLFCGRAAATDYYYSCGSLAPNTWCQSPNIHTYGVIAAYEQNYTAMNLCAKLTDPIDTAYNYARRCDYGITIGVRSDGGGRAPYPNNSVSMRAWVANGANASSWVIYGNATY